MVGEVISYKEGTLTMLANGMYLVQYIDASGIQRSTTTDLISAIQILDANYLTLPVIPSSTPTITPLDPNFYQGAVTYYKTGLYGQGTDGYYWIEYKDKNGNQQRVKVLTINPSLSAITEALDKVVDTPPTPSLLQRIFPNIVHAGEAVEAAANDPLRNPYAAVKSVVSSDNTIYYVVAVSIIIILIAYALTTYGGRR
jgi:hypothetical protein